MTPHATPRTEAECPSCVRIGQFAAPIDAGHTPLAHRLYRICTSNGPTSRAKLAALSDAEFLDLRNSGVGTLALLRRHIPAPAGDLDAVRAALADLEDAGLRDLRPGSLAVGLRCDAIKRFGLAASQSLIFLQHIRRDYGARLAANLGQGAVDELTDSLIRAIAAVAAPENPDADTED